MRTSKREAMHLWFAAHRLAATCDDQAAARYESLAARATEPESREHFLLAAEASRASAQANRAAMAARTTGTYSPTPAERALARSESAR